MFESYRPFRSSAVASWEHLKLQPGKKWLGFVAGPCIGMPTHFESGTIGCRKALSRGALRCTCDVKEIETRWRGYLPLWDLGGVRWFALLGERFGEIAMRLPHMAAVYALKTDGRGTPIKVDALAWTHEVPRLSKADQRPQDIRPWLLRIWGDDELTAYLYEHGQPDIPLDKPITYAKKLPEVHNRLVEDLKQVIVKPNAKDAGLAGTLDAALNGIHKRVKKG